MNKTRWINSCMAIKLMVKGNIEWIHWVKKLSMLKCNRSYCLTPDSDASLHMQPFAVCQCHENDTALNLSFVASYVLYGIKLSSKRGPYIIVCDVWETVHLLSGVDVYIYLLYCSFPRIHLRWSWTNHVGRQLVGHLRITLFTEGH